jgi:hypothetical protein
MIIRRLDYDALSIAKYLLSLDRDREFFIDKKN